MNPHTHAHARPPVPVNRRGFFVAASRSAAFVALAAFATWEEAKRRRLANDPNCLKLSGCADCVELGRCPRPRAESARRSLSRT